MPDSLFRDRRDASRAIAGLLGRYRTAASRDLQEHAHEYARRTGQLAEDEFFHPEQSSPTVKAAEQY